MTDRHDLFRRMREALAECYPQRPRAELFAQDIGLSLAQIDLSGAPIEFWQRILEEAERQGKVEALLGRAFDSAPAKVELDRLRQEYHALSMVESAQAVPPFVVYEPQPAAVSTAQKGASTPRRVWPAVGGVASLLAVIVYAVIQISGQGGKPTTLPAGTGPTQAPATMTSEIPVILPSPTRQTSAITSAPSPPATAQITLVPAATMISPIDGMVMVWVPAGEFTMGSANTDTEANSDEKPQHRVYIEGFWISRTEITNAQYSGCVRAGACAPPNDEDYTRAEIAERPVTEMSWHNANEYARWVGGRLPTEAEWEKACRGTDGRIYPWGSAEPTDKLARYSGVTGARDVGSYPEGASFYGLFDMAGNVWEWTSSGPREYPYRVDDGREGPDEKMRVLRGGAFDFSAGYLRCAVRFGSDPDSRNGDVGFRVVTSPIIHGSGG